MTTQRAARAEGCPERHGIVSSGKGSAALAQALHQQAGHTARIGAVGGLCRRLAGHLTELFCSQDAEELYVYQDPTGQQQGPFPRHDIQLWLKQGYFTDTLPIRLHSAPPGTLRFPAAPRQREK